MTLTRLERAAWLTHDRNYYQLVLLSSIVSSGRLVMRRFSDSLSLAANGRHVRLPLLRSVDGYEKCLLVGMDRKWSVRGQTDAFDPKRTVKFQDDYLAAARLKKSG